MGQAEVAAVLDVSIPTISEWENDKKQPRRDRIIALARLFDVSTDFLLHGGTLMRPDQSENEEEISLVALYRNADPDVRIAVMTLLRAASSTDHKR